jgi:diguanylate cyclase (GGDEF)-like protein
MSVAAALIGDPWLTAVQFVLGMLVAIALLNLMLFGLLRQTAYLLFALAMCAMIGYQITQAATVAGLTRPHLAARELTAWVALIAFYTLLIAFAHEFLELPRIARRTQLTLSCALGVFVLNALLYLAAPLRLASLRLEKVLDPLVVAVLGATLVVAGLVAMLRGIPQARFYVVAFAGAAAGFVTSDVLDYAVTPAPPASDLAAAIGVVWAALFLGLALAERIRGAERQAAQLGEFAYRDQLTAIPNRRSFDETLDREWRRALRNAKELSLVMFDIDHFKAYNDRYGHQRGDECLKQVAAEIADAVRRGGDFAARYGGEEFALILADTGIEGAQAAAESVRVSVRKRNVAFGDGSVTISAGCATLVPADWQTGADLIAAADAALYIAKATGRDRVVTS